MSYRLLNHVSVQTRTEILSTLAIRNRAHLIRDAIRGKEIRREYVDEIRNSALNYTQPEDFDDSEVRGHAEAFIRNNPSSDLADTLRLRLESHRYLEEDRRNPPQPRTAEEIAELEREMAQILDEVLGDRSN